MGSGEKMEMKPQTGSKKSAGNPAPVKGQKNRRNRQGPSLLLGAGMLLAAAVLCISGWQVGRILWGYHSANASYNKIAREMETEMAGMPDAGKLELTANENSLTQTEAEERNEDLENEEGTAYSVTIPDFDYLQSINQDVVGWIQIPGTVINYPIVQGSDNEFYLTHTYAGQENSSGAIFMDAAISNGFDDKNPILYGHNLKSGAMFSRLNRYARAGFWQEHPFVYITTPEHGQMIFQVFAAYQTTPDAPVYYYGFGEDAEFEEYLNRIMSYSVFDANLSVTKADRIVTLSTCANDTEYRFVVHAKRIES